MKLYYSKSSPFARKVIIHFLEAQIFNQVELVDLGKTGTFTLPIHFESVNPLLKIPALELKDKSMIIDSRIICEYIDSISIGRKLIPTSSQERFFQLKIQAIADGLLDAAVLRRYESIREPHLQSKEFDQKQNLKITNALQFLDQNCVHFANPYTIGEVATMAALGYLDFRFSTENWRAGFTRLADWHKKAQTWEPFQKTNP